MSKISSQLPLCPDCNLLLDYIAKSADGGQKLVLRCSVCGFEDGDNLEGKRIKITRYSKINKQVDVIHDIAFDPTLMRTRQVSCGNKYCPSHQIFDRFYQLVYGNKPPSNLDEELEVKSLYRRIGELFGQERILNFIRYLELNKNLQDPDAVQDLLEGDVDIILPDDQAKIPKNMPDIFGNEMVKYIPNKDTSELVMICYHDGYVHS